MTDFKQRLKEFYNQNFSENVTKNNIQNNDNNIILTKISSHANLVKDDFSSFRELISNRKKEEDKKAMKIKNVNPLKMMKKRENEEIKNLNISLLSTGRNMESYRNQLNNSIEYRKDKISSLISPRKIISLNNKEKIKDFQVLTNRTYEKNSNSANRLLKKNPSSYKIEGEKTKRNKILQDIERSSILKRDSSNHKLIKNKPEINFTRNVLSFLDNKNQILFGIDSNFSHNKMNLENKYKYDIDKKKPYKKHYFDSLYQKINKNKLEKDTFAIYDPNSFKRNKNS